LTSRSSSRRNAWAASRALRLSRPRRANGRSGSSLRPGLNVGTNDGCTTPSLRSSAGRPMSARWPRKNRRASGGQLPRRSSSPGFSRKWTDDGTSRGASRGSSTSAFRDTAGSSTRRGLPRDSSQNATPELVVPRSSAQPVIRDPG
jgi:hypothetical protein